MQEMQEIQVLYLRQEDPLEKEWQHIPGFLPGEFHGQRSLVGCSPWGRKDSDRTCQLSTHNVPLHECVYFFLICLLPVSPQKNISSTSQRFLSVKIMLILKS